jgi:hypothetical protein
MSALGIALTIGSIVKLSISSRSRRHRAAA